jgi:hypothetical protein
MIERDRLERERAGRPGDELRPRDLAVARHRAFVEVREQYRALERRELPADRLDDRASVEVLAAVRIAVDRDQDLGRDLGEAIDQAACPELRGAARPDRAEAGTGQQRDDGLRHVRDHGHDPVAAADAKSPQPGRDRRDGGLELRPRHEPKP